MMDEKRLEPLWEAYRQATPEPEPTVNFMPRLWARIEAAQPASWTVPFTWLASRLLPVAALLTLAMAIYVWSPRSTGNGLSYVDVLAADLFEQLSGGMENI